MYDALTTTYTLLVPAPRRDARAAVALPPARAAARARSIRPSTASSSPAAAATSTPGSSRTTTSTGRRSASSDETTFVNLMTSQRRAARRTSSRDLAAARIKAGEWPWSFFCWPEERPRPVFPSAFRLLAPTAAAAIAWRRRALPVLRARLGEPRLARARRRAVHERPRGRRRRSTCSRDDAGATVEEFRAELDSESFDARRLDLELTRSLPPGIAASAARPIDCAM